MPKRLCLSAIVELPSDRFEAAGLTFKLSVPWQALLKELDSASIKYEATVDEMETRAKPGRPRKPRVVAPTEAAA